MKVVNVYSNAGDVIIKWYKGKDADDLLQRKDKYSHLLDPAKIELPVYSTTILTSRGDMIQESSR